MTFILLLPILRQPCPHTTKNSQGTLSKAACGCEDGSKLPCAPDRVFNERETAAGLHLSPAILYVSRACHSTHAPEGESPLRCISASSSPPPMDLPPTSTFGTVALPVSSLRICIRTAHGGYRLHRESARRESARRFSVHTPPGPLRFAVHHTRPARSA